MNSVSKTLAIGDQQEPQVNRHLSSALRSWVGETVLRDQRIQALDDYLKDSGGNKEKALTELLLNMVLNLNIFF